MEAPLYARLNDPWMLRGWSDGERALVNLRDGDSRDLPPSWFHVASSCDGSSDFTSPAFTPRHRAMLAKFVEWGIARECPPGEPLAPLQRYREATNPRISGLHWSVTGRCNLRCRHCYMEAASGRYGELPTERMLELVAQFGRANLPRVVLTGGEPFLRDDLPLLIDALAGEGITVAAIYTNGVAQRGPGLEALRRHGFSPLFQVSFDGVGFHDGMRGVPGVEARTVEAIRLLREEGWRVSVSTSIDALSAGCLDATYELLLPLGIEGWAVATPQEAGDWRGSLTCLTLPEEEAAFAPLLRRWMADGRPFVLHLGGLFKGSPGDADGATPSGHRHTAEEYDCATCREMPSLLPDGTLIPCPGYTGTSIQESMPNLLVTELSAAWSDSSLRTLVDRRKGDLLPRNPECGECDLFGECGMGCRAMALTETGDVGAADPVSCATWKGGGARRFKEIAGGQATP
jgi:radical SAM protein with 4Fe4S-binding SPASM domain